MSKELVEERLREMASWVDEDEDEATCLEAADAIERLTALVEQAFRDGLSYASNVEVSDPDLAWEHSRVRAILAALPSPPADGETKL